MIEGSDLFILTSEPQHKRKYRIISENRMNEFIMCLKRKMKVF